MSVFEGFLLAALLQGGILVGDEDGRRDVGTLVSSYSKKKKKGRKSVYKKDPDRAVGDGVPFQAVLLQTWWMC